MDRRIPPRSGRVQRHARLRPLPAVEAKGVGQSTARSAPPRAKQPAAAVQPESAPRQDGWRRRHPWHPPAGADGT
ncbi:hypothetical protein MTO96_004988 [Rhipicephalus appendiculatus]